MKIFLSFLVVAAALAFGGCDNSTEPTKATTGTITKNPPLDQDTSSKSSTGGDQPANAPQSK